MASDISFVKFVADQIELDCQVTYRRMFGEFGLYSRGKLFAVICDNRLFVKPTNEGRAFIGKVVEGVPYPGAKPRFLIEDRIEDGEWLSQLVRVTTAALPEPKKPKKTV